MTIEFRDYQNRIVNKVIGFYSEGTPSVSIVSPTGSGKTVIALQILKEISNKENVKINWVAMRHALLRQAAKTNNEVFVDNFNLENITFVSMFDDKPPPADIVVLDEHHHAATTSFVHIDTVCKPKFLLGLSATPMRSDRLKLPFSKTVQDAQIHRLIQEGWLPQYHHHAIEEFTPEYVAETYAEDMGKWGKSISYFHTIDQCEQLKNELEKKGIKCEYVHGGMPESKREDILDAFEAGEFNMLTNVAILTEGFDAPDLNTVWVRDSIKLPTIQMCLDTETEILTQSGWKNYDSIDDADISAAFDQSSGEITWTEIEEIIKRPISEEEHFCTVSNQHLDIRVTDQHDMVYRNKSSKNWLKKTIDELSNRSQPFYIPVSGVSNGPGVDLADDELELLGLYLSDGCFYKKRNQLIISQSTKSDQIPIIEEILSNNGINYNKSERRRTGRLAKYAPQAIYTINKTNMERMPIFKFVKNGKIACLDMLDGITTDQLHHLLVGMHIGDGKKRRTASYTPRTFSLCLGNDYEFIDKFQTLCIQNGYRCNLSYYKHKPNDWNKSGEHGVVVNVKKQRHSIVCGKRTTSGMLYNGKGKRCQVGIEQPEPGEMVWCIRNKYGTIVTRRNGKVAIMGNCGRGFRKHPGKEFVNIVQSVNTNWQFTKTAKPAEAWVKRSSEWLCLGDTEIVMETARKYAQILPQIEVEMPAFIQNKTSKKRKVGV